MDGNKGFKVTITWRADCPFVTGVAPTGMRLFGPQVGTEHQTVLRNITEIHYGFKPQYRLKHDVGQRCAFESDVHSTGFVYDFGWIDEMEVVPETEIAASI